MSKPYKLEIHVEHVLSALQLRGIDVGEMRAKLSGGEPKGQKHKGYIDITLGFPDKPVYATYIEEKELSHV